MSEKILNTRIQLRYDSFSNWKTPNDGRGALLKKGELAVAYLAETKTTTTPDNGTHPIMFKVGPGYFNELPWASALAADVYGWAKAETKPTYKADEITVEDTKELFNGTNVETILQEIGDTLAALTGSNTGSIAEQIQAGIKAIQGATAATGNYVTGVSIDENGNLKVSEAALPESATPEQGTKADSAIQTLNILGKALDKDTNTLSVDEAKTALSLGSAAYTESTAYATDEQGAKADTAIQGVKVNGTDLTKDSDNKVDITDSIKAVAAAEINTLIGGVSNADTIEDINTLITYVNENGADTTAILTELYGESADTTKDSRIDTLEKKAGLDKVGTVTSVTAGTGLTGGTFTESGTIALDEEHVKGIKVNAAGSADKATDADKLGGTDASEYITKTDAVGYSDILTKTDAQETITKANTALQTISAGTGLKVAEKANNNQEIGFDPDCVFVFDCGDAFGNPLNTNN